DPKAPVTIHVRYEAPANFIAEVTAPEEYAGDAIAYVGSEMWFYSRQGNYGIHVTNAPFDQERWRDVVRESVGMNRAVYGYDPSSWETPIAGRRVSCWAASPKEKHDLVVPCTIWLDDEYSIPLKVVMGSLYASCFEKLTINGPAAPLRYVPPENAMWFDIDMAKPLTPAEAEKFADFDPLVPHVATDMSLTKILRTKQDGLPVLTFVYERGPFVASITESMDRGYVDPGLRGIPVEIARDVKGRLQFCGTASALVFVRQGVAVSLLTNLPPHLALELARTLAR
ncbi:MAG TPA: hypothetical protein VFF73_01470, partial [Planctomycetota bacterium]|nr:hypothetical protein [Planctomycetota bacterium]